LPVGFRAAEGHRIAHATAHAATAYAGSEDRTAVACRRMYKVAQLVQILCLHSMPLMTKGLVPDAPSLVVVCPSSGGIAGVLVLLTLGFLASNGLL
jgi:hypothetical protein